jgi:hypothetical protein
MRNLLDIQTTYNCTFPLGIEARICLQENLTTEQTIFTSPLVHLFTNKDKTEEAENS